MGFQASQSELITSVETSAMDIDDRGFPKSRFNVSKLLSSYIFTPRLQPCDNSMLDLTIPFSHAASPLRRLFSEGLLLLRLAVRLWSYLGVGWKWSLQLSRLVLYAMLLLPGFLQMIVFYILSPRVLRSIVYGPKPRQRLDLYRPPNFQEDAAYPVVVYVTGGAWIIGYKAWGALLARRLSEQGVLVACLDYRNFPQGDALDMLEDVNTGISWVLTRIDRYGGNPDNITLVGQSAGGHLAGLALIKQAEQAAQGSPALGAAPSWSPASLRAFVGVSGAFDLEALADHLHRRGLYKNLFERIMSLPGDNNNHNSISVSSGTVHCTADGKGGSRGSLWSGSSSDCGGSSNADVLENGVGSDAYGTSASSAGGNGHDGAGSRDRVHSGTSHDASGCRGGARPAYDELSPLEAARRLPPTAAALMPYTLLIHGTADKTVPAEGSARLCEALTSAGAPRCRCLLVPGKTHTAFLLEDPMRGGRDLLSDTVLGTVTGAGDSENQVYGTLCPGLLCDLAGWVCPF